MKCLRCGRETDGNQAFCPDCLLDMEMYPVKPGTAVQLPIRPSAGALRKPRVKEPSAEEKLVRLRKRLTTLRWLLLAALAVIALLACLLLIQPETAPESQPLGRNFRSTHQGN